MRARLRNALVDASRTSIPPSHPTVIRSPSIAYSARTKIVAGSMGSGSLVSTGAILARSPTSIRSYPLRLRTGGPQFSPDGKMLAFERIRLADDRHAVFVQPIGSPQDARQITPWKSNCQDHPDWSADGKLLLFRCLPDDGSVNVYWVRPDGTGLHQLTQTASDKQTHNYLSSGFSPSFLAGEGWITTSREPGYGEEGNADVFRMRIEDGEVVSSSNLTKSTIWDSSPDWGSHKPVH
jgi:Tol biopolymer transport system component